MLVISFGNLALLKSNGKQQNTKTAAASKTAQQYRADTQPATAAAQSKQLGLLQSGGLLIGAREVASANGLKIENA